MLYLIIAIINVTNRLSDKKHSIDENTNMLRLTQCSILLLVLHSVMSATLNVVTIPEGDESNETCPLQEKRDVAIQGVRASVQTAIETLLTQGLELEVSSSCGSGQWYRVAHLNMSDPAQQCPSAWTENSTDGVRTCGRPPSSYGSCLSTVYPTGRQYSRVCGRAIGYQYGSTEAFDYWAVETIDSYYVYGVSVTHGCPRNHIWTFAAGVSEGGYSDQGWNCPCSNPGHPGNVFPPSFVGNNYYCESGNPANMLTTNHLYSNDPLWDGEQCEGQCCSNGKSPPWFGVELPNPTTNNIEVRICIPQRSIDDIKIQLFELYVQ